MNIELREFLCEYLDDDAIFFDGFDEAILGVSERFGEPSLVVYSKNKVLDILKEWDMTEEEAVEYFYYNVLGTYAGEYTPVFVDEVEF